MNKNHLRKVLIFLLFVGIFSSGNLISEKKIESKNLNQTKNKVALVKATEYDTVTTYNKNIPSGTVVTKEEGHVGLAYVDEKNNTTSIINDPKNAEIEIGTGQEINYVGKLTGYGNDCKGCSGNGVLACKTKTGNYHSLISDGEYYDDVEYGKVRILAAALEKFPCGTIVNVENSNLGTFTAIVLDTGSAMKKDLNRGIIHMDLAFKTEKDPAINLATGNNIKYSVQRWGY